MQEMVERPNQVCSELNETERESLSCGLRYLNGHSLSFEGQTRIIQNLSQEQSVIFELDYILNGVQPLVEAFIEERKKYGKLLPENQAFEPNSVETSLSLLKVCGC